jgi:hypothetical protein
MKSETITQRILTADEGMYLTDGQTYGKTVVLPVDADQTVWHEVTEEELPMVEELEMVENA